MFRIVIPALVAASACLPFPASAGPLEQIPEVAKEIRSIKSYCQSEGQPMKIAAGFLSQIDVDGNGDPDLILDDGKVQCGSSRPYCGSGGCTVRVWLATPYGLQEAMADLVKGYTLRPGGNGYDLVTTSKMGGKTTYSFFEGCAIPDDPSEQTCVPQR